MKRSAIVSPDALAALAASFADFVLVDARPRLSAYAAGHLTGAVCADPAGALSGANEPGFDASRGGRHPLPPIARWARTLGDWGVGPATEVVIYDEEDGSNAAARAWWMLRSVGHTAVSVLDGGLRAAREAGLAVTTQAPRSRGREPYPAADWQLPTADWKRVDEVRLDPGWKVLDVRARARFLGETEPIDPIAGHIPGAVNLHFLENLEGGRWKSPDALRRQYEALLGGTDAEHLIVHCGSGVTACHTLLALHLAGLDGAALYIGSWSEWCRNELPREPAQAGSRGLSSFPS